MALTRCFVRTWTPFALVVVGVGVAAGLAGVLTSLVLRTVQTLAYGDGSGTAFTHLAPGDPVLRILLLAGVGLVLGVGWWMLHRTGRSPVSISAAVGGARMHTLPMVAHVLLQLVSVGVGGSIGREVAPRELAALAATWADKLLPSLTARRRRLLVAAGAGAGLAAAYRVPVAGTLFAVEILLAEFSLGAILIAATVSGIAALVSWLLVTDGPIYPLPPVSFSPSLLVWALAAGVVIGFAASGFSRLTNLAATHRQHGRLLPICLAVTFASLGAVSLAFPQTLGNGQSLAAFAFSAHVGIITALTLGALKTIATVAMIGSGAYGGTLTPSLSLGAVVGLITGTLWVSFWPGSSPTAFALCGAAAFLAGSMAAPLTALALTMELTGTVSWVLVPMIAAIALSTLVRWLLDSRAKRQRASLARLERSEPPAEASVQK
ncbi:chloride channel protein [Leifsonia sp. L25]|uniref:chloride channel protein n=1 Tax=Leifsonia sp. L25 TaxID=3423957 RepID=UPI003D68094B